MPPGQNAPTAADIQALTAAIEQLNGFLSVVFSVEFLICFALLTTFWIIFHD